MLFSRLLCVGLLVMISSVAVAQDDVIDDLPQERKEATKAVNRRTKKKAEQPQLQPRPNTDVIDDLSPEQKAEAAKKATHKAESAIPDDLADALARALHNSPAILVADAKVRQAQAELNEVRLSVVQELTAAFQRRANNKEVLAVHEASLTNLRKNNAVSKEEQQLELAKHRQPILEDESRILYLLGLGAEPAEGKKVSENAESGAAGAMGMMMSGMGGMSGAPMMGAGRPGGMWMGPMMGGGMGMGPMMGGGGAGGSPGGGMNPAGMMGGMGGPMRMGARSESSLPEKLQKSLQSAVELHFSDQPLGDVLDYLSQAANVTFVRKQNELSTTVTMNLQQVPLEAGLQAIADLTDYCFVIRDYGILVISREDAGDYMRNGVQMISRGSE